MPALLSYSGSRPALTPLAIWAAWPQTITRSAPDILMILGNDTVKMEKVGAFGIFHRADDNNWIRS